MESYSIIRNLEEFCKKEQLLDFCYEYDIPIRTSWTKVKLAAAIGEKLLQSPELLTLHYSMDDFAAIQNLVRSGGSMTTENLIPFIPLIGRGLANMDLPEKNKFTVTLCKDFLDAVTPKIDSILSDKDFIYQDYLDLMACGVVNMYGILSETEMVRKFNYYSGEKFTKMDLLDMILRRDRLKREIRYYKENDRYWHYAEFLFHPGAILKEIRSRKGLDYAVFPMEEVLRCGTRAYIPGTSSTALLLKELKKRGLTGREEMVRAVWIMVQNDLKITDITSFLSEHIRFTGLDDVNSFFRVLMDFTNTLPKWVLKGNTSDALFQTEKKFLRPLPPDPFVPPAAKTIRLPFPGTGRNEPCPCGSGKKYKNCCGRISAN